MEKKDAFLVSSIVIFVSKWYPIDFQAIARNIGMTCYDVSSEKFWVGHTDKYYYGHPPCSTNFLEGQDLVAKPNLRPSSTSTLLSSSSSSSSCFRNVCVLLIFTTLEQRGWVCLSWKKQVAQSQSGPLFFRSLHKCSFPPQLNWWKMLRKQVTVEEAGHTHKSFSCVSEPNFSPPCWPACVLSGGLGSRWRET